MQERRGITLALLLVAVLCCPLVDAAATMAQLQAYYSSTLQTTQTTYAPYTSGGNCGLDPSPSWINNGQTGSPTSPVSVGIDSTNYHTGQTCSMCFQLTGSGSGTGTTPINTTFTGYVNNDCAGCNSPNFVLGDNGNGQWAVNAIAIPCPIQGNIQYQFQGSSGFFLKLQVRNTAYPIYSIQLVSDNTGTLDLDLTAPTDDYFFTLNLENSVEIPLTLLVTDVFGRQVTLVINTDLTSNSVVTSSVQFTQTTGSSTQVVSKSGTGSKSGSTSKAASKSRTASKAASKSRTASKAASKSRTSSKALSKTGSVSKPVAASKTATASKALSKTGSVSKPAAASNSGSVTQPAVSPSSSPAPPSLCSGQDNNLQITLTAPTCTTVTTNSHNQQTGLENTLQYSQAASSTVSFCLDFPNGQSYTLAFYDHTGARYVYGTVIDQNFVLAHQSGSAYIFNLNLQTDNNVSPGFCGSPPGPPAPPGPSPSAPGPPPPPPPPPPPAGSCQGCTFASVTNTTLSWSPKVVGSTIVNSATNHPLRGVARPSLEWNNCGQNLSPSDYNLMGTEWGTKVVRLSLNQDYWLSGAAMYAPWYQCWVYQNVQWAKASGQAVILDLHWTDCGDLSASSNCQQPMADVNSLTFWTEVATMFKDDPAVMFEMFNEPQNIPWSVWLNGGSLSSSGGCCQQGGNYQAVGMQQLYNAVRATGANNIVLMGGINWAFDLSGVGSGYAVAGSNFAYVTHPYDYPGKLPANWDAAFGYLTTQNPPIPVFATEFGQYCNNDGYVSSFVTYAQTKNIGWTAWAWFVQSCGFPSLITDWSGTPDPTFGTIVQTATKTQ